MHTFTNTFTPIINKFTNTLINTGSGAGAGASCLRPFLLEPDPELTKGRLRSQNKGKVGAGDTIGKRLEPEPELISPSHN